MKIADLKKIGENVGRFASVRETAKEPQDRIVIQANGETVKVVAGASYGTLIATAHATEQTFRGTISAREFLTTIKGLPAKREVMLTDLDQGFAIGCSLVDTHTGEVYADFLRLTRALPKYLLPPDLTAQSQGTVTVDGATLEQMAKVFSAVTDEYMPDVGVWGKIQTLEDTAMFTGWNGYHWASSSKMPATYDIFGSINGEWVSALRGIGDCQFEFWTDDKVTAVNDTYRAVGPYKALHGVPAGPVQEFPDPVVTTVVDRLGFKKDIQDIQKFDKHGRVMLQFENNVLKIRAFDETSQGWRATGEKLIKVLNALSTKQVGIGLRTPNLPINVRVPEWRIEIAPVVLSKVN